MAVAQALQTAGQSVVVLDADPQRCRAAEQAGLTIVYGNALQDRTLLRVPIEDVGTALGATFNDNLNSQFVGLARHTFGVGRGLVSVQALDGGKAPEHVRRNDGDVLFEGPHDQEQWDVRWRHRDVDLIALEYTGPPPPGKEDVDTVPALQELFVLLTHTRGGKVQAMSLSQAGALKSGDRATAAVYRRDRDKAIALLQSRGWQALPTDIQPGAAG